MTTGINQVMNAIREFDAWKEEQVLIGVDTSIEAYEGRLQNEENGRIVARVRSILSDPNPDWSTVGRLNAITDLFTDQKEVSE